MKRIQNLVEMLQHRGSNYFERTLDWLWIHFFSHIVRYFCPIFTKQRIDRFMRKTLILFVTFTLGLMLGEFLVKRSIIDDCRILRATRFGEVYISCGTAQKL